MVPHFECHSKKWDLKFWPKLDVDKPASFQPWFMRARRWIIDGNPDIERLMLHLEKATAPILTDEQEFASFRAAGLPGHWSPSQVSRAISDAITFTGEASVASASAMIGENLGFELYRHIYQKFRSVGPDQGQRILDEYLHPKRCKGYADLQSSLLSMAQTERELKTYGDLFMPNLPQQTMALEKRLPLDLLRHLEDQMISPLDYLKKKEFVQHRVDMEVARSLRAGASVSSVAGGVHREQWAAASHSLGDFFDRGDEDDDDEGPRNPQPYFDELFLNQIGLDRAQVLAIQAAGLKIGKGKGDGRQRPPVGGAGGGGRGGKGDRPGGGGGRGGGKADGRGGGKAEGRGNPARAPVPPELSKKFFEEGCFYCGSAAHRRPECPKLTAALKARGLRRVDGQWVDAPTAGAQNDEDWYLLALEDGDGNALQAVRLPEVLLPPPPAPTGASARPPRTRPALVPARFAPYRGPCGGNCEDACHECFDEGPLSPGAGVELVAAPDPAPASRSALASGPSPRWSSFVDANPWAPFEEDSTADDDEFP